jgi:hypothetical protein
MPCIMHEAVFDNDYPSRARNIATFNWNDSCLCDSLVYSINLPSLLALIKTSNLITLRSRGPTHVTVTLPLLFIERNVFFLAQVSIQEYR